MQFAFRTIAAITIFALSSTYLSNSAIAAPSAKEIMKAKLLRGATVVSNSFKVNFEQKVYACGGPIKGKYVVGTVLKDGKFISHSRQAANLLNLAKKSSKSLAKKYTNKALRFQKLSKNIEPYCNEATPPLSPQPTIGAATHTPISSANGILWSDPKTWDGKIPTYGSDVTIPSNKKVILDIDTPSLGKVTILGTLEIQRKDLKLTAELINVFNGGMLIAGDEENPFVNKLTITLTGVDANATHMGGRGLMVMDEGKVQLIGIKNNVTWTMLNKTADSGTKTIELEEAVDWKTGDEIIITSTDYDYSQTEKHRIVSVSGKKITLAEPLKFLHFGEMQYFTHGLSATPTELDERAEVGLLTHNIKVVSPEGPAVGASIKHPSRYGGHIMMMGNAVGKFQGVELNRMGQFGELGRYPIHWHGVGNAGAGSFIRASSVHNAFNRCITVHKTNHVVVEDNVAFDTFGHCFFVEDGREVRNAFIHNLGALVKAGPLLQSDVSPAVFWTTNPNNDYVRNAAAGAAAGGSGFFYAIPMMPARNTISANPLDCYDRPNLYGRLLTQDAKCYEPRYQPLGKFQYNRAHSIELATLPNIDAFEFGNWGLGTTTLFHPAQQIYEDFTAFKIRGVAADLKFSEAVKFLRRARIAGDRAMANNSTAIFDSSLAVATSANPTMATTFNRGNLHMAALAGYDGFVVGLNSAFYGYKQQDRGVLEPDPTKFFSSQNWCSNCRYINSAIRGGNSTSLGFSDTPHVIPDPDDSFGNGQAGSFINFHEGLGGDCKGAAQGAGGIGTDDPETHWCPGTYAIFYIRTSGNHGNLKFSVIPDDLGGLLTAVPLRNYGSSAYLPFKSNRMHRLDTTNTGAIAEIIQNPTYAGWSSQGILPFVPPQNEFFYLRWPVNSIPTISIHKATNYTDLLYKNNPTVLPPANYSTFQTTNETAWYHDASNGEVVLKLKAEDGAKLTFSY